MSAFFGLDSVLPGILCNQPGILLDGMPVNFIFPIDASSLSETDFKVVDSFGLLSPICVSLAPANENGENRTLLLFGEFGTAVTNPPVEVRIVGDLFTVRYFIWRVRLFSNLLNLNGTTTTNVIPLAYGPSLFFAQRIDTI